MKRTVPFLVVAVLWSATDVFAQQPTITFTTHDPRNDPDITEREWGARLRNFRTPQSGSEIYVGSGDLSFAGNRKVADLVWNSPPALNNFMLTYTPALPPALARITMNASGSTSAGQFYDLQTQVNQSFSDLLIEMKLPAGNPQIVIQNLVLTITGGPPQNLGNVVPPQAGTIWALISNIPNAYASGFTLTGNLLVDAKLGGSDENPVINFTGLFDRTQPFPDLTLTKSHAGSFTQGQAGATYTITARNIGAAPTTGTVTVVDNFPPSLSATSASGSGWTCSISVNTATCTRSDSLAPGASYPPITLTVNVASTTPPLVVNAAVVTGGNDGNSANNTVTDPTTIIRGPDLTIAKTANGSFTQGLSGAGYTLTVGNTGGIATTGIVSVIDNFPTGLSPATISGPGWSCAISGNTATCTRSDPLAPGASYPPITATVNAASNAPPSVTNVATVGGGGDLNAANNAATVVTSIARAPDLTIAKSHAGNFTQGQTATYTVTVTNIGAAPTAATVVVADPMFLPLTPRTASGSGWTCDVLTELIRCQTSAALAPGASYPPITMTASIAPNAPPTILNMATVTGGGDANASNNTATDPTTIIPGANLTITKSHTGNFTQGQTGSYTLTVSNVGGAPTLNPVIVTDNLPSGLAASAAAGTGWSCTAGGQSLTCERSDVLNAGASYPPITLTVDVAPNAPASVTNTAQVSAGSDVDSSNNTASDPTTVVVVPDLTVTKTHTGSFLQGQVGATYSLTVANVGSGPTGSQVTISDSLPAGLTPTAAAGAGWVCNIAGQAVTCSRTDALNGGASYPAITLTVNVAPAAPPTLTNTAMVSGGGEVNTSNNTADDITTIGPGPDLVVTKSHSGDFRQGQIGATFTITVSNPGSPPSIGVVTVTDNVPTGLLPTSASGAGWICTISGQDVICTRSDPLPTGQSYPAITLTVNVQSPATGSVTNVVAVSGGGDVNPTNNSARDIILIVPGADLTITKTHTGHFIQGRTGIYAVTVTNAGVGPTTSTVTVLDPVPLGLTPTAAVGAGWTCTTGSQGVGCQRSDALAAGAAYPPIAITVNVATDAPPTLTNTASVSGGGDGDAANNTANDATTILPGADTAISKSHAGSFTQGQKGATYTITVGNTGGSPTNGEITVVDDLPTGLVPSAAIGSGWTCDVLAGLVQCQRSDALAAGGSYPPITITVNIDATAPASATNTASVLNGSDVNGGNNTASDPTTIAEGPDLTLTKTHTAVFTQGQRATPALGYTLTAQNVGASPTTGTVTLIDSVPPGLTPVSASGAGWTCSISPQSVTCTRGDALAPSASYPTVTLTVDVESDAPASVTNTATIAGGGDVDTSNNTATDFTQINSGQNLAISKSHTGPLAQGQRGVIFTITVTNGGGAPTLGTVTLIDTVPTGLFPTAGSGTGWTCTVSGQTVNCTRGDPLAGGASYPPVTITVDVAADAPASITNTAIVAGGGDVSSLNNVAQDSATVALGPDLNIVKTHPRSFGPGQAGVPFILTVTNGGGAPTEGLVNVVDDLPVGLTAKAASGAGWTCEVSADTVACSRADALAPGASYPSITLTADVARNLPVGSTLINRATVSRGGDVNLGNNTAEDSAVLSSSLTCDVNGDGTSDLVTGAGPLGGPHVRVLTAVGSNVTELASFFAYDPAFTGGVFVACGDLTGDGIAEVITGAGPGGGPHVRVFSVTGGNVTELASFFAYDPAFAGGVTVATGDIDGDGTTEIITGAGAGGGPHVRVLSLGSGGVTELAGFFAYDPAFTGGVTVAAGDIDGDGAAEIITGAGAGGGPHVRVLSLSGGGLIERASFFAYEPTFAGGVFVAAGDVTGDGVPEVVTGAGPGGVPDVRVWSLADGGLTELGGFTAYDPAFTGGVHVATGDIDGDGVAEIIAGAGAGGGPHVRAIRLEGGGLIELAGFFAYDPVFAGGVFVASGK